MCLLRFAVLRFNIQVSVFEAVEKSLSAVLNHPMKASLLCPWGTDYHVPKTFEESKLLFFSILQTNTELINKVFRILKHNQRG